MATVEAIECLCAGWVGYVCHVWPEDVLGRVGGWDVCRHVSEDVPGMADGRARLAARVRRRPGLAREVGIMAAVTVRNLDDQVKESRRVKTAD